MAPSPLKSQVASLQMMRTTVRRDDSRDVVMKDEMKEGGKRAGSNVPDSKLRINKAELSKPHATILPESDKLVHAWRSPLSLTNDPRDVLAKLLRMPTLLTTAEVLAISKELSSLLAEQIRPKMVILADVPSSHAKSHHVGVAPKEVPKSGESLIYATASYDTHTFPAVLDSGSKVSLIREDVWRQLPGVSVDKSQVIVLIDTSGGKTEITGCIEDLTLTIHGVPTTANYWVSKNSPPDILLGRDWQ